MKIQIIVEGFKLNGTHRFADGLFFINLMNKFFILIHVSSTIVLIFRRTIVLVQHLVSSLSLGDFSDHRLREDSVTVSTVSGINETVTATCFMGVKLGR